MFVICLTCCHKEFYSRIDTRFSGSVAPETRSDQQLSIVYAGRKIDHAAGNIETKYTCLELILGCVRGNAINELLIVMDTALQNLNTHSMNATTSH